MCSSKLQKQWVVVTASVALVLVITSVASACPTCKDSLAVNDPDHANLVRGYFWSILFMMSMPFLILGGLGSYMYLEVKRARAAGSVSLRGAVSQPAGLTAART